MFIVNNNRIRKVTTWMFMYLSEDILIIMIRC